MISAGAELNSLINILNYKYSKNDIVNIKVGIGASYGRSLMIKAGYSGSGINDVVWMGDVVNQASNLCNEAGKLFTKSFLIDGIVYTNLNDQNKGLFSYNTSKGCYEGDIINTAMEEWYKENCK